MSSRFGGVFSVTLGILDCCSSSPGDGDGVSAAPSLPAIVVYFVGDAPDSHPKEVLGRSETASFSPRADPGRWREQRYMMGVDPILRRDVATGTCHMLLVDASRKSQAS